MFAYFFYKEGRPILERPEPYNPYIDASTGCLLLSSQRPSDMTREELYKRVARDYRRAVQENAPYNLRERVLLP